MRTPITLKIKFKSSSLDQFIERYSVDVSRGGIFIRTKEPLPVGTTLRFEFQLQDNSSLIGGEGTVVWNRANDPARTGVAPGMGVRFDKLTADSQRVLERILSEKHKRGEAQLESRFDAGVRANRDARNHEFADAGTPLPQPVPGMGMHSSPGLVSSPGAGSMPGAASSSGAGGFGDEPTRMMAADQMSQLAADMQSTDDFAQDQPTRRATLDEIRRAVSAGDPSQPPGRTSESSKMTSAMGVVDPRVAAGARPTSSSQDIPMPPSLSTREVSPEEASALIAASARTPVPDGREQPPPAGKAAQKASSPPSPPVSAPPLEGAPSKEMQVALAQAATLVDAPVPSIAGGKNGFGQTLSGPPPSESADFLSPAHAATEPSGPVPSGISIGLDFDTPLEGGGPAVPGVTPISSSPPPPRRDGRAEVKAPPPQEPPLSEVSTGKVKATAPVPPPERRSALRSVVQIAGVIGVIVLVASGIYALRGKSPFEGDGPVPMPPEPAPHKLPPPVPAPPPEAAQPLAPKPLVPEVVKPPAQPEKVDPASKAAGPDKGPEPPGDGKKPGEAASPEPNGKTPVLSINSDPPGARVELQGKAVGETPLQVKDLQPGKTYDVKLSLRGFQDNVLRRVRVQAGDNKVMVVKLMPYERIVEVNSNPKNAEVLVDGKKSGRTPLVLRRLDMSKIHEIEVRKGGYAPQTAKVADTDTFDVRGGREVRSLTLTLEALPPQKVDRPEPLRERHEVKKPAPKVDPGARKPDAPVEAPKVDGKVDGQKPEPPPPEPKPEQKAEPKASKPEQKAEPQKPEGESTETVK